MEIQKGLKFPADEDLERLKNYLRYDLLFKGKHYDVYANQQRRNGDKEAMKNYIVCNFAGIISKTCADLLYGEGITIEFPTEPENSWLQEFISKNQLPVLLYENQLQCSARGDSVVKLSSDENGFPIAKNLKPYFYFPSYKQGSIKELQFIDIAWVETHDSREYLRVERHYPGFYENSMFLLEGNPLDTQKNIVGGNVFNKYYQLPIIQQTGISKFTTVHIQNFGYDDCWGISDYIDLEGLFDEFNNRVSRIGAVLDKHERPKMAVPEGLLDDKGQMSTNDFELIEVAEGSFEPKYITWDAQLQVSFNELDRLNDLIFMVSEISSAIFGKDKEGQVDSGKALKFRMIRTLAKINRKKLYNEAAIKEIIKIAMEIANLSREDKLKISDPHIIWKDGLPQDMKEFVDIEVAKAQNKLTSRWTAIKQINNYSDKNTDEEFNRISNEDKPEQKKEPIEEQKMAPNNDGGVNNL